MEWDIVTVPCDDDALRAGYAYTVGLSGHGHPELVIVGLGAQHAQRLLTDLSQRVCRGERLSAGDAVPSLAINPSMLRLVEAPDPTDDRRLALQVVYADFRGAFPWDASYRYPTWLQRLPAFSAA